MKEQTDTQTDTQTHRHTDRQLVRKIRGMENGVNPPPPLANVSAKNLIIIEFSFTLYMYKAYEQVTVGKDMKLEFAN